MKIQYGNGESYSYTGPYVGCCDNIDGEFKICENTKIEFDAKFDSPAPPVNSFANNDWVVVFGDATTNVFRLGVGWCLYPDDDLSMKACNSVDCNAQVCHWIVNIEGSSISVRVNGISVSPVGSLPPANIPWIGHTVPLYMGSGYVSNIKIDTSGNCGVVANTEHTVVPSAILAYEFKTGDPFAESISSGTKYRLQNPNNAAETSDGKLILKTGGYVYTADYLDFSLGSHSLEAYVKPSTLFSVGGGVAGISSPGGGMFESIVYNEHNNGLWFAGSEWFHRTKYPMTGANVEPESCIGWTHMVITYDVDNALITMYRNGVQYGDAYHPSNPMLGASTNSITPTGNWKYLIGPRGLGGLGHSANEFLGEIDFSRLYNVVLTAQQISALYQDTQKSVPILYNDQPKVNGPQWGKKPNNDIHIIISHQMMNILIGLLIMVSILLICCVYSGKMRNKMSKGYGTVKQFDTESEIEI